MCCMMWSICAVRCIVRAHVKQRELTKNYHCSNSGDKVYIIYRFLPTASWGSRGSLRSLGLEHVEQRAPPRAVAAAWRAVRAQYARELRGGGSFSMGKRGLVTVSYSK